MAVRLWNPMREGKWMGMPWVRVRWLWGVWYFPSSEFSIRNHRDVRSYYQFFHFHRFNGTGLASTTSSSSPSSNNQHNGSTSGGDEKSTGRAVDYRPFPFPLNSNYFSKSVTINNDGNNGEKTARYIYPSYSHTPYTNGIIDQATAPDVEQRPQSPPNRPATG